MEFENQKINKTDVLHIPILERLKYNYEKCVGHWSQEQHTKYVIFVDFFEKQLNSKLHRRSNKIYKTMSKFIQTRDPIQCRSHHIKLIRTFRNIKSIVRDLERKIGLTKYFEAKSFATSNYDIFNKDLKQTKQEIKLISYSNQNILNNVAVQTDLFNPQNVQLPIVSPMPGCDSKNSTMQIYVCTVPWAWLFHL